MYKVFFLFFIMFNFSFAIKKEKIIFAPLPTKSSSKIVKEFLPIITYLENKLSIKVEYKFHNNYQDILNGIKDGSIDMAYLGPLPFVSLKQQYKNVEPIITFKEKNGKHKYRCVLVKFKADNIDYTKELKIALTQPLSTCGYFMSKKLLKKDFQKELSNQKYDYLMSHENALTAVLKEEFHIAGAKDSIAKSFDSLGMEIISSSSLLPGFTLVINTKNISKTNKEKIQNTLLDIPPSLYKKWKGKGSHGLEKVSIEDYKELNVLVDDIPKKGNLR